MSRVLAATGLTAAVFVTPATPAQRGAPSVRVPTPLSSAPRELWRVAGSGHGRPAVASGIVYFLAVDHGVEARTAASGALLWSAFTGEPGASTAGSSLVVSGDLVIAGDYNLVAFERRTGVLRWRFTPAIGYGPGIYLGDATNALVLAGSPAGRVYAVRAANGELEWSGSVSGAAATTVFQPRTDGVIVASGYTVFTAPNSGGVVAYSLSSGLELWRTRFPAAPDPLLSTGFGGGLAITPDEVVASCADGTIYGLARKDGAIRWSIPGVTGVPPAFRSPIPLPDIAAGADYRPLVAIGSALLTGSLKGAVVAYDLRSRRELWRQADGRQGSVSFGIAADTAQVYVPFASGRHVAFDLWTGREMWHTLDAGDQFNWPAAYDGDRVYLSGGRAYVAMSR